MREILCEFGVTVTDFAKHIGVSRSMVSRILNRKAGISADMSIRLAQAFGQPTEDIWLRMQADYDMWRATHRKRKKVKKLDYNFAVASC